MMMQESIFFKRYGIKFPSYLLSPRINSIDFLEFPKSSIYHFNEVDGITIGPQPDDFFFRNITKRIAVQHVIQLDVRQGNPRKLSLQILPIVRTYHSKNRRFRWLRPGEMYPHDENQLVVINYALCSRIYKYVRNPFAEYNKWYNITSTVFYRIGQAAKESKRNQYVIFKLPKQLPSVPRLNIFTLKSSQQMLKFFADPNAALILEIWKWLDPQTRYRSALNYIDPTTYNKVNFIFEESGKWILFNLGLLDSWIFCKERPEAIATEPTPDKPKQTQMGAPNPIKPQEEKDEVAIEALIENTQDWLKIVPKGTALEDINDFFENKQRVALEENVIRIKIIPDQIRKRFLRCLMTLMGARTVETSAIDKEDQLEQEDNQTTQTNITVVDKNNSTFDTAVTEVNLDIDSDPKFQSEINLENLDEDLKQLEIIEKDQEMQESIDEVKAQEKRASIINTGEPISVNDFEVEKDHTAVVKDSCDKLAKDGFMTAAEHRAMMNLVQKSLDLDSPQEGVKMKDYIEIKPSDLAIKEVKAPDKITILDKSQLSDSLNNFDKDYIEKVLDKDTVSMALATQKAGFVVTDYKIQEHKDILGGLQTHILKINPVIGKSSTITFKVPKIDPNGEYKIGGVGYRMRKQRTDLPIKKIGFNKVQLSSYYGKVFVSRSDKKVNDYASWLLNQFNAMAQSPNEAVVAVKPGNVFNNLDKTPFLFSSIARNIKEIIAQGYTMYFDLRQCKKLYGEVYENYHKSSYITFGDKPDGTYLLMDENGTLYTTDGNKTPEVFATFEEFFNLDSFKAPVEFAECLIFGQTIPLALMLSYYYGLSNLLAMLKVAPRRVLTGQRVNLQSHEWAIDFADETLVFNKDDRLSTLILAGFSEYAKAIRNYSVYKFDQKAVYLTVLDQRKITTRYIRELDLLDDMFVDPITEQLLVQMHEPKTFRALMVRSAELLLRDHYADPLDMQYCTIKGYERVAGAVYTEVVAAVREQRRALGRSASKIVLNPLAVWKRVTTDPAIKTTEDINPVNNLKEMEAVTFNGYGGRSSRTMNAASRIFHENDKGVISEATSDSADVGINTYTVANPSFNSVRGTSDRKKDDELTGPTLMSTSANLAVGIDTDD